MWRALTASTINKISFSKNWFFDVRNQDDTFVAHWPSLKRGHRLGS